MFERVYKNEAAQQSQVTSVGGTITSLLVLVVEVRKCTHEFGT